MNGEDDFDIIQSSPSTGASFGDYGLYYLANEISISSVRDVVGWILDCNLQTNRKYQNLTLMITSYGGDLSAAFALIDIMRGSAIPIRTVGLGVIASAGLLIFISGQSGERILTPNTSILSHQWSWGSFGKEHELVAVTKQYELLTSKMIRHYKKCTKLSEKKIREKLLPAQDVWMSAEEALTFKLADEIRELT